MRTSLVTTFALASMLGIGCSSATTAPSSDPGRASPLASDEVTLTDFEFDGELVAADADAAKSKVEAQMFYFVGILFPENANARINFVELSNTQTSPADGGLTRLKYH